jgi:hypothetical protein
MLEPRNELGMHVVCMDCNVVITVGDPNKPISHGLCAQCFSKRMAEIDAMKRGVA